jgi:hypothetical protein
MQSTDKPRFLTLITGIADYYGKELSQGVISLYWQGLQQYDLQAVEKALWEHTQNPDSGQFMPKIADLTRVLEGRTQDQAAIAWSKVDYAVRTVGPYRSVAFDDALIHRVLSEMGGWINLGNKTTDEWPFVAREFENRYRGYRMRGETPDYPPVLLGISNMSNSKEGYSGEPPMLLGDARRAEQAMLGGSSAQILAIEQMKPQGAAHALEWAQEGMPA